MPTTADARPFRVPETGPTAEDQAAYSKRWWTLAVLCLSLLIVFVGNASLNVAIPTLSRELHATTSQLQWVVAAYSLVFAGLLFSTGALGDRFGRKGALQLGLVGFLVAAALASESTEMWQLIGCRAAMGASAALIMPSTLSILVNVFPPHERTKAIAIWAATTGAAGAIGPVASGFLLGHFWYGSVFLVNVPIIAVALIAGWFLVPRSRDPEQGKLDPLGAVLSIIGISALVYGLIQAPDKGWASGGTLGAFAIAFVVLALFVAWELRVDEPMLDMSFFKNPAFSTGTGGMILVFLAMYGVMFLVTQYFQLVLGYSPLSSALRTLPMAPIMIIVAPLTPRLSKRFGSHRVVAGGMLLIAVGFLMFRVLAVDTPYWYVLLSFVPLVGGIALTMSPMTAAIMGAVPARRAGAGSAMNDASRELGAALGVAVLGSVAASHYASAMGSVVSRLPAGQQGSAETSLAGALETAAKLPAAAGHALTIGAQDAFIGGIQLAVTAGAILAVVAAVIVYRFLPHVTTQDGAMHGAIESMEDAAELGLGGTPPIFADVEDRKSLESQPVPRVTARPTVSGVGARPIPTTIDLDAPDPRRWFTLAIVVLSVLIVALDTTVLNVAIPTILRDLDTTLPSLQWVITGYSLTFASLLIIGGRLADLFGARRTFVVGAILFGVGSLLASLAQSVPVLILGEAVIEGIGASLMMPATLGILSSTFRGHERATAFAIWGATVGIAVALGPLIGGFLTTNYSWRWSFRINLIVVPLTVLGALLVMSRSPTAAKRERIDIPGAVLVAGGMFLLVFSLSEGTRYGWWRPLESFGFGGAEIWPASRGISVVPVAIVVAIALLAGFYVVERHKERHNTDPLFEFGQLRRLSFRYGLLTTTVLAMGQLGFLFVLPVFLQNGMGLSAVDTGLWLLPSGISIIVGTQIGARLTRSISVTSVVRIGLVLEALGLLFMVLAVSPSLTFVSLIPGLVAFGLGIGFAGSQLTNVILSEIPNERSGAASGANTTVRQLGAALGIAVIGGLLTSTTISHAVSSVRESRLSQSLQQHVEAGLHANGVSFTPPRGTSLADVAELRRLLDEAVAAGTRSALLFAMTVVVIGAFVSVLIPRIQVPSRLDDEAAMERIEALGPLGGATTEPTAAEWKG